MMKKLVLILMAVGCIAVSCQKKEGKVLSPDEQKSAIEETAVRAIGLMDVDNWKDNATVVAASASIISSATPDKSTQAYIDGIRDSFKKDNTGLDYEVYEYDLTKETGAFSISNGVMTRTESQGLSLSYDIDKDTKGSVDVTVKNSKKKIIVDRDYSYTVILNSGGGVNTEKKLKNIDWLVIPSSVDFAMKAGNEKELGIRITTDFNIAGDEFAPTDKMALTTSFDFGEYDFSVTRARYSETEVILSTAFSKGKTVIFSNDFVFNGKLAVDGDDIDSDKTTGTIKVDGKMLDNVELKGTIDYTAMNKAEATLDAGKRTPETVAAYASAMEKAVDISVYVDGTAQARLGFEPVAGKESGDEEDSVITVIRFKDGSAYELADEFFDPENYAGIVKAANDWMTKIENFFNPKPESAEGTASD